MTNPIQVAQDIALLGLTGGNAAYKVTVTYTAALQRQVVANASGRPGPNAPTGDYRRSINRLTTRRATGTVGQVGTDKPQGRRLEFGFTGADSLGRNYNQPPYPHFGPALDKIAPEFEQALAEIPGITASRRGPR